MASLISSTNVSCSNIYNAMSSSITLPIYVSSFRNFNKNLKIDIYNPIYFSYFSNNYAFPPANSDNSTMVICYSCRLINKNYSGPIFKIRRSTDNVMSYFYTDSIQSYLTTGSNNTGNSFSVWIGTATAYISIWYDQSSYMNNASNITNNTTQPILVFINNRYIIKFINTNDTVLNLQSTIQPNTIFCHFWNNNGPYVTILGTQYDYQMRFFNGVFATGGVGTWYAQSTLLGGTCLNYVNGNIATSITNNVWNTFTVSVTTPQWVTTATNGNISSFNKIGKDGYSSTRSLNGYMTDFICHNKQITVDDILSYNDNILFNNNIISLYCVNYYSYYYLTNILSDLSLYNNSVTLYKCDYNYNCGGCIYFDGANSYMYKSTITNFNSSNFSIICWINPINPIGTPVILTLGRNAANINGEMILYLNNFADYSNNTYGFNNVQQTNKITTTDWYQYAFVKNGTNGTFYLNGNPNGTFTANINCLYNFTDFCIGKDYRDNNNYFTGNIGSITIFSTSLTYQYIKNDYITYKTKFLNNCVLYIDAGNPRCYQPSFSIFTLYDLSGTNNNLYIAYPSYNSLNGGYFNFTGLDSYIQKYSSSVNIVNMNSINFSIILWFNPTANFNANIFNASGTNFTFDFYINSLSDYNGFSPMIAPTTNISTNAWYQRCFVKNNYKGTFYLNGKEDGYFSGNNNTIYNITDIRFCVDPIRFTGNIAIIAMFNTALTATDIANDFQINRSRFGL